MGSFDSRFWGFVGEEWWMYCTEWCMGRGYLELSRIGGLFVCIHLWVVETWKPSLRWFFLKSRVVLYKRAFPTFCYVFRISGILRLSRNILCHFSSSTHVADHCTQSFLRSYECLFVWVSVRVAALPCHVMIEIRTQLLWLNGLGQLVCSVDPVCTDFFFLLIM